MASMKTPAIGALHRAVAGSSLSLALACDLAIESEDARFSVAYSNVGASLREGCAALLEKRAPKFSGT